MIVALNTEQLANRLIDTDGLQPTQNKYIERLVARAIVKFLADPEYLNAIPFDANETYTEGSVGEALVTVGEGDSLLRGDLANGSDEDLGAGLVAQDADLLYATGTVGDELRYLEGTSHQPKSVRSRLAKLPIDIRDYGVTGNDNEGSLVDETSEMNTAIAAALAEERELYIPGTNYLMSGLSLSSSFNRLVLRGDVVNRPVIHMLQASANAGSSILSATTVTTVSVTVTADILTGQQIITVASTTGLAAGMMLRLTSTMLWYYDHRDQYYKGEVHLITRIIDSTHLEIHGQTWDTYDISVETVTAVAFTPRRFAMSDVHLKGKEPATAVATVLLQARGLYMPEFDNIKLEHASSTGIQLGHCWHAKLRGIEVQRIGRESSVGYGISDLSSVGSLIDGLVSRGCRRAVDFSSFTGTTLGAPTRNNTVTNFDVSGGGVEGYGGAAFEPAGAVPSFGVGTHGPAENSVFKHGKITNIGNGITVRGRNTIIHDVHFAGKMAACIQATYGSGLRVSDCTVDYTDYPNKSADTAVSGDTTLQPNYFLQFGGGSTNDWTYAGASIIQGTKATGLRLGFIKFGSDNDVSQLVCQDNVVLARPGSADTFNFYDASDPVNVSASKLGPNHLNRLTGAGAVVYYHANVNVGYYSGTLSAVEIGNRLFRTNITDDDFSVIRFATLPGSRVIVTLSSDDGTVRGVFQIIPQSATFAAFGTLGSNVEFLATVPTGTTGTDGKVSLHLTASGALYIENRRGATVKADVSFS